MKSLLKITMVVAGFTLATIAGSFTSKASSSTENTVEPTPDQCLRTGQCGTTPNGTKLNGTYTVGN